MARTTGLNAVLLHIYVTAGLYISRLNIVDNTTSSTYISLRRVMAQDLVELRETLCSVYGYLRTNLASVDVTHAVLVFDPDQRDHYQTFFSSISTAKLPVAAARLGAIANGLTSPDYAQLKVVEPYQGKMGSFPMDFSRDAAGAWRIDWL